MRKKLQLLALALMAAPQLFAQSPKSAETDSIPDDLDGMDFTMTESQLGEDDDMTNDVIQVGSSSNVYTSNINYAWSAARFKFRALDNKYNDVYINGLQVNNAENGRFQFSNIGGINDATRNRDAVNPFEDNTFSMSSLGGSTNYDFRAGSMAAGQKITLSGCNRNYTLRAMYSYGSGWTRKGWAVFGTIGYRWANMNTAYVDGTFYNSLSYFLAVQKKWGEKHMLNLATWANPTERAQQGASTDEAYWLANDRQYNPYWGYQDGRKRASRIVNDFAPSVLLTWDFKIKDNIKLVTSAFFKYQKYSSSKLNYSGTNPAPDYWKSFPSYYYDVWDTGTGDKDYDAWSDAYDYWTSGTYARQIKFDDLYFANTQLNKSKSDAIYYIQDRHNDQMTLGLSSNFNWNIDKTSKLSAGIQLNTNTGYHYQTMNDLLGGEYFHNVNTYAIGTYPDTDPRVQYDLNHPNKRIYEGDRFGYDYDIYVQKFNAYTQYSKDKGSCHSFITGRIGGTRMWRDGHMRNGLFADNSYGKSGIGGFLDGGFKMGSTVNLGKGHAVTMGVGMEAKAPHAKDAFINPEMCNDFVINLRNQKIVSAELEYAINNSWLRLNLNGYFYHSYHGTEWQCYFDDNEASFTYVSMSNITKNAYGVELGAKFKITSSFDIVALGTYSDTKYVGETDVNYMLSNKGTMQYSRCYMDGVREGGTPLAAASLALNYRIKGWFLNLTGNYYDRIYLSATPVTRLESVYELWQKNNYRDAYIDNNGRYRCDNVQQARGNGGFMLDASIGKQFRVAKRPLSVNLQLCNITNNTGITTGGYEQSRSNYSVGADGTISGRTYNFEKNPKKFYAQGFNFMLNVNYRF